MSNIMRISGDYRSQWTYSDVTPGIERAVVGLDTETNEWVVEYGTCVVPFNPSQGFDVHTVTRHANDTIAGFASDLWCGVNLYRYAELIGS